MTGWLLVLLAVAALLYWKLSNCISYKFFLYGIMMGIIVFVLDIFLLRQIPVEEHVKLRYFIEFTLHSLFQFAAALSICIYANKHKFTWYEAGAVGIGWAMAQVISRATTYANIEWSGVVVLFPLMEEMAKACICIFVVMIVVYSLQNKKWIWLALSFFYQIAMGISLGLSQTKVSDAGLVHLKPLVHLTGLILSQTKISDAGLVHLKSLTNLTKLSLSETNVTKKGIEKLKKALPKCKIEGP